MSTWSARHDPPNNNSNSPLGIDTEFKGKRGVIEKVVVKNLKLLKPDINNQIEVCKEMEYFQKDPTLNQLNGTDDTEEDFWFMGNLYDSPPQSPPMSPSVDTHDWSGDEKEKLELTRLKSSPTLSREEFEEFIERDNENSAADLEILRRQLSPDRPSDMNGQPKAERTIGLEILSQLSPDRPLDMKNAPRPLENPIESSQEHRFSATSGPLTLSDVFWPEEPPPPALTPQSSPPSIRSTRSTSCRLSISSSASSISPVKIPKVGRKTRQTRRTKEAMNAMSSAAKVDMKRVRNKFHARDSLARKKEENADWGRRVQFLELKLGESAENNRQLEIGDFDEAMEATRALSRFKLNDEIAKIKSELAEIETEKAKKELKATTRASQKCRANAKLKLTKLKLRALDLLAKIDMEQAYGRELLENTSTESEVSEPPSVNNFSPGAKPTTDRHEYRIQAERHQFGRSASADSLPICQPDGTAYIHTPPDNVDWQRFGKDRMYHSDVAAEPYNCAPAASLPEQMSGVYNGQANDQQFDGSVFQRGHQGVPLQIHSQTAHDGHSGMFTEKQMEYKSVDAPRFNGAPAAQPPEQMGGAFNGQAACQQFAGGFAPQQDLPPPYKSTVYDGQTNGQPFGGTTHMGQIAAASQQFRGPVTQYGHNGAPLMFPEQRSAAASQRFRGPVFQHGNRDAPPEHAGFTRIDYMSNEMNYANLSAAQYAVDVVSRYEETFGESPDDGNHERMDVDDAVWQSESVNAFNDGVGYSNMPNRMNYTNLSAPMSQEKAPAA
ncbi:hypothetical protein GCK72_011710 [Caenorhabditis remanei]|uniref:Uncharacterized protein n=1 Tax=Caenorhabditis remanei TaxID=31234 RepID=A0A6A5H9F8_CAERE|nr:hypothetical protein GCK72_011710 [Caenorhabditis remanei]KAF1763444.1 hypothetical protein GCK72_011710 [Caenorhabditis remanei]